MIRLLVSVEKPDDSDDGKPIVVRAFVKTTEKYEPIKVAIKSEEKWAVLLQDAINDIIWFKQKHKALTELTEVFLKMDEFIESTKEDIG